MLVRTKLRLKNLCVTRLLIEFARDSSGTIPDERA
jgi:hypothetical protein